MKLVCVRDEVELRPIKNGVQVVEYSANGPYKLWEADEYGCPECDYRVVTGFGQGPVARPHEENFQSVLAYIRAHPDDRRNDFEDQSQREEWRGRPLERPGAVTVSTVGDMPDNHEEYYNDRAERMP